MPWWSGDIRDFSEEEFHGYFGDIRSVAVRTLPRRPPKELLALLNSDIHGLPEPGRELVLATPVKSGGVYMHGRPNPAYSFYDFDWDLPIAQGTGEFSYHPSNSNTESQPGNSRGNGPKKRSTCSQVEKTMLAISGYLAVAILILIIIVGVLVVSLQNLDNNIDELKSIAAPLLSARSKNNGSTSNTLTSLSTTIRQTTSKSTTTRISSTSTSKLTTTPLPTTTTTPKPTTTPLPTTTRTPKPTTTPIPTTTTSKSTTTPLPTITTTPKPTTTQLPTTTTTPKPTTTPLPTTTTSKPTTTPLPTTTTTPKPTTTPIPTTTTSKPTTIPLPTTTTTPKPTTTPIPTTTTSKPTTTPLPTTTTTPKPTTTPIPTTTTSKPTTTPLPTTTTTPKPTTTPIPTTTTSKPTTTQTPATTTASKPTTISVEITTPKPTTTPLPTTTTTPLSTTTTTQKQTTTPIPTTTTSESTTTLIPTTTSSKPTTTQKPPSTTTVTTTKVQSTTTKGPESCDSQYCSSLAYDMLGRINSTIDPCVDFYQYACGSWITSRQTLLNAKVLESYRVSIESDKQTIIYRKLREMLEVPTSSQDSVNLRAIKMHYQSCFATNTLPDNDKVTRDLAQTMQTLFFNKDTLSSFSRPAEMQFVGATQMGSPSLYNYDVVADIISGTKLFVLQLEPPSMFLPIEFYEFSLDVNQVASSYIDKLTSIMERVMGWSPEGEGDYGDYGGANLDDYYGGNTDSVDTSNKTLKEKLTERLRDVFEFERKLAKLLKESENDTSVLYMTPAELSDNYPSLQLRSGLPYEQTLEGSPPVKLRAPSYFQLLNEVMRTTNEGVVQTFIYSRILLHLLQFTPIQTRRLMDNIYSDDVTPEVTRIDCVNSALKLLEEEILEQYSQMHSNITSITNPYFTSLVQNLTQVIIQIVSSSSALSEKTKQDMFQRLFSLQTKVSPVNAINLQLSLSDNPDILFVFRAQMASGIRMYREYQKIGTPVRFPTEVTWYKFRLNYDPDIGILGIPFAMLTEFIEVKPEFPIVSSSGWKLATEMISAMYGSLGREVAPSWWSSESRDSQTGIQNCYLNQLYESPTVEGRERIGAIMSGQEGLQLVDLEYRRLLGNGDIKSYILPFVSFTPQEFFYISFAQGMCEVPNSSSRILNHYRVNNILRNVGNFADTFKCGNTTNMNPVQKCSMLSTN